MTQTSPGPLPHTHPTDTKSVEKGTLGTTCCHAVPSKCQRLRLPVAQPSCGPLAQTRLSHSPTPKALQAVPLKCRAAPAPLREPTAHTSPGAKANTSARLARGSAGTFTQCAPS